MPCAPRGELNRGLSYIIHAINLKRIIGIVVEIAIIAHAEKLHLHSIALHKTVAAIRLPVELGFLIEHHKFYSIVVSR